MSGLEWHPAGAFCHSVQLRAAWSGKIISGVGIVLFETGKSSSPCCHGQASKLRRSRATKIGTGSPRLCLKRNYSNAL